MRVSSRLALGAMWLSVTVAGVAWADDSQDPLAPPGETTVEDTFARLVELAGSLDAEQKRAVEEGLSDEELALFDLLFRENMSKADRERLKQASKRLLASLRELLGQMLDFTQNTSTQAEVKVFILDSLWQSLPRPPFTDEETEALADRVYDYVWQRSATGRDLAVV